MPFQNGKAYSVMAFVFGKVQWESSELETIYILYNRPLAY